MRLAPGTKPDQMLVQLLPTIPLTATEGSVGKPHREVLCAASTVSKQGVVTCRKASPSDPDTHLQFAPAGAWCQAAAAVGWQPRKPTGSRVPLHAL